MTVDLAHGPMIGHLGATIEGDGPESIVFLNGFGTEQTVWRHQVETFRSSCRTITFDHVGSGRSAVDRYTPARYASLYDYADDVLALIDEVAPGRFSLVGHSVGGMLAAIAAVAEPARCRGLVMIGASPRYLNAPDYVGGFEPGEVEALLAAMTVDYQSWIVGFSAQVAANPDQPSLAAQYAGFLRAMRPDIAQASLRTIFYSDMRDLLPKVSVPTLIVQASADIAVPAAVARHMHAAIRGARLQEVEFAGHLPHMLAPAVITDLITGFLGPEMAC